MVRNLELLGLCIRLSVLDFRVKNKEIMRDERMEWKGCNVARRI